MANTQSFPEVGTLEWIESKMANLIIYRSSLAAMDPNGPAMTPDARATMAELDAGLAWCQQLFDAMHHSIKKKKDDDDSNEPSGGGEGGNVGGGGSSGVASAA
jgi:hypothetical protein